MSDLRRGDWVLVMTLGNIAVLARAQGDVSDTEFTSATAIERATPPVYGVVRVPFDAAAKSWDYGLQRQLYVTEFGRCMFVWPAGMPAPALAWVNEAVRGLRPPAMVRAN